MKVYQAEIEVVRLYTVRFMAEDLPAAAERAREICSDANAVEELADSICKDFETNLVGVSRQVGRKMYQF